MNNTNISSRSFGFTLVEVIVTAAIVAIIAIASLVAYSGYIRNSRQQTVDALAETAAAAASAYVRKTGPNTELDAAALQLYLTNPADYSVVVTPDDDGNSGTVEITDLRHEDISATRSY